MCRISMTQSRWRRVNEIENLTNGLSRKIWQKIMIFDRILAPANASQSPRLS